MQLARESRSGSPVGQRILSRLGLPSVSQTWSSRVEFARERNIRLQCRGLDTKLDGKPNG